MKTPLRSMLASKNRDGAGSHTHRGVPSRTLGFMVALAWFVWCYPVAALAYGIYEAQILGGDAPELFSQAFPTPPPGPDDEGLAAIEGYLDADDGDLADLYCLFIGFIGDALPDPPTGIAYMRFTPEQFSVATVPPQGTGNTPMIDDPQLFLFDAMGHPVVGNDDIDDTNQQSAIPPGTITVSGLYILAVTGSGYDPTDAGMNLFFTNNSTGLRTPTNAGAIQAGWTGDHTQDGFYRVRFGTGVDGERDRIYGAEHWVVPFPSTLTLLLSGFGGLTLVAIYPRRRSLRL